ncbi:MAG: hypothetical protein C0404_03885 [Verrucomicrobia bacterium]|nr:hypothetical protein [Verrucomicrobiota bacterium]
MKVIDIRSFAIGLLVCALVVVGVAGITPAAPQAGQYTVSTSAGNGVVYVCLADTQSGHFSLARYSPVSGGPLVMIGTYSNPIEKSNVKEYERIEAKLGGSSTNRPQ